MVGCLVVDSRNGKPGDHHSLRVQRFDLDKMNHLYEKEFIGNPFSKAKSVVVLRECIVESEELFDK
jgi:hypothetical protein